MRTQWTSCPSIWTGRLRWSQCARAFACDQVQVDAAPGPDENKQGSLLLRILLVRLFLHTYCRRVLLRLTHCVITRNCAHLLVQCSRLSEHLLHLLGSQRSQHAWSACQAAARRTTRPSTRQRPQENTCWENMRRRRQAMSSHRLRQGHDTLRHAQMYIHSLMPL